MSENGTLIATSFQYITYLLNYIQLILSIFIPNLLLLLFFPSFICLLLEFQCGNLPLIFNCSKDNVATSYVIYIITLDIFNFGLSHHYFFSNPNTFFLNFLKQEMFVLMKLVLFQFMNFGYINQSLHTKMQRENISFGFLFY